MVRLAVLNATARDIERLANAIQRMESASGDPEGFTLWDEEFHQLIAEATRNPLMVWIYRQINTVRTHSQWNAMKDKVLTPARIAEYNTQHYSPVRGDPHPRHGCGGGDRHQPPPLRAPPAGRGEFGVAGAALSIRNPSGEPAEGRGASDRLSQSASAVDKLRIEDVAASRVCRMDWMPGLGPRGSARGRPGHDE